MTAVTQYPAGFTVCDIDPEDMPHIMGLLSTSAYSRPHEAVVRELVANAVDTHLETGQDRPVLVTLPSIDRQELVVQDFGSGLSEEELLEVAGRYGKSTKRSPSPAPGAPKQVGRLGIGFKSPFAVSDQFVVDTTKDGQRVQALFIRAEDGMPMRNVLLREGVDAPNGTTITVPVPFVEDGGTAHDWAASAQRALLWRGLDEVDVVNYSAVAANGGDQHLVMMADEVDEDWSTGSVKLIEDCRDQVVVGGIAYPVPKEWSSLYGADLAFMVAVDDPAIEVAPSREELISSRALHELLTRLEEEWYEVVVERLAKRVEASPDGLGVLWELERCPVDILCRSLDVGDRRFTGVLDQGWIRPDGTACDGSAHPEAEHPVLDVRKGRYDEDWRRGAFEYDHRGRAVDWSDPTRDTVRTIRNWRHDCVPGQKRFFARVGEFRDVLHANSVLASKFVDSVDGSGPGHQVQGTVRIAEAWEDLTPTQQRDVRRWARATGNRVWSLPEDVLQDIAPAIAPERFRTMAIDAFKAFRPERTRVDNSGNIEVVVGRRPSGRGWTMVRERQDLFKVQERLEDPAVKLFVEPASTYRDEAEDLAFEEAVANHVVVVGPNALRVAKRLGREDADDWKGSVPQLLDDALARVDATPEEIEEFAQFKALGREADQAVRSLRGNRTEGRLGSAAKAALEGIKAAADLKALPKWNFFAIREEGDDEASLAEKERIRNAYRQLCGLVNAPSMPECAAKRDWPLVVEYLADCYGTVSTPVLNALAAEDLKSQRRAAKAAAAAQEGAGA